MRPSFVLSNSALFPSGMRLSSVVEQSIDFVITALMDDLLFRNVSVL